MPKFDRKKCCDETVEIAVQINGKIKARILIPFNSSKDSAVDFAMKNNKLQALIGSSKFKKIIFVPNRLLNLIL